MIFIVINIPTAEAVGYIEKCLGVTKQGLRNEGVKSACCALPSRSLVTRGEIQLSMLNFKC